VGLINYLIMAIDHTGYRGWIYQAWIVVVYIVVGIFCLFWRKHYGYKWFRSLLIPLFLLLSLNILILLIGWALTGFTLFGVKNIVVGFPFVPFLAMGFAKLMKDDWKRMLDYMSPVFPMTQVVAKISCCFAGCCFGYPMAHGMWNPIFKQYLFPVQIVEGVVALIITFIMTHIARRQEYRVTGRMYPIFLILFGGTRFFLEFLRLNVKMFWGLSMLSLWALLGVVIGAVWLILDNRKQRQLAEAETEAEADTEAEETQD